MVACSGNIPRGRRYHLPALLESGYYVFQPIMGADPVGLPSHTASEAPMCA